VGPPSGAASIQPVVLAVAACMPSSRGVVFMSRPYSSRVAPGLSLGDVCVASWPAKGVRVCDRRRPEGPGRTGRGLGGQVEDQASIQWRKSTLSTTNGCVEVAVVGDRVAVRDSKQRGRGPVLEFTATEWAAFLAGVRGGEFDLSDGR
jgi:hypothetical protein